MAPGGLPCDWRATGSLRDGGPGGVWVDLEEGTELSGRRRALGVATGRQV